MSDYVATHMSAAERVLQVRQRPKLYPPELLEDLAEAWEEGYEHEQHSNPYRIEAQS